MKDPVSSGVQPDTSPENGSGLQAVDRVMGLLHVVSSVGGTLATTARGVGMSEATASRYLTSLAHHQMVERDEVTRTYRIGPALLHLAYGSIGGDDLITAALPGMRRLRELFAETVNLAVRTGETLTVIHALESPRSIRKGASVGERDYWNCTALGKAILALLPEHEAQKLMRSSTSPQLTERTRTRWHELTDELVDTRNRGYAMDDEESEAGLRCIGAAIFNRDNEPKYAISVSGPANRLPPEVKQEIGTRVFAEATAIARRLGASPPTANTDS